MGNMKKGSKLLYDYKELGAFFLFSILCAVQAWAKGCLNEFGNVEFWVVLMGVILLMVAVEFNANKLLITAMLMLMTVSNLIRAGLQVYHFHDDNFSQQLNRDYILALVIILVVMVVYPKFHRWLTSDIAIAVMAALTLAIYAALFLFGQERNGAKAWLFGLQLTEPIKILFIFVIAGLLSKRKTAKRSWLAVLYMVVNAACMGIISEYGTLIVMGITFLLFLLVFPNKLSWLAGILGVGVAGVSVLCLLGSTIYSEAMMESPSAVFAEELIYKVRTVRDDEGQTLSGVEALQNILREVDMSGGVSGEEEQENGLGELKRQLEAGEVTSEDFSNKTDAGKAWLAGLCGNPTARQMYIDTFCRDDFYGNTALSMYDHIGSGPVHWVKKVIFDLYNKVMQRFIVPMNPLGLRDSMLHLRDMVTPYQTRQAAKAMQIGGLTGASSHEFIYVPVMKSDMIFSQIVSFFGFAMGFFVILMYMIMFREGIRIQKNIEAPFHQGVALGLSLMLFVQALVIIAGNLGLFPLTGITLPLLSDGTASLCVTAMMLGILVTISFVRISEQTGPIDAFFGWVMRKLGADVGSKVRGAVKVSGKTMKNGARKVKEMAENMGDEDSNDDIEENDDDVKKSSEEPEIKDTDDGADAENSHFDGDYNDYDVDYDNDYDDDDDDGEDAVSILGKLRKARAKKSAEASGKEMSKNAEEASEKEASKTEKASFRQEEEPSEQEEEPLKKETPKRQSAQTSEMGKIHQPKKRPMGKVTIFDDDNDYWEDDE